MREVECIVTGRVQGVMFRDFVRRKARRCGVVGTVENLPDGSVRVVAQGDEDAVQKFVRLLHRGSILARVENVSLAWRTPGTTFTDFSILYR